MLRISAALLLLLALVGGFAGVATAEEPTAERTMNATTVQPGETVEVTMAAELSETTSVDYVEEFEPAFADASFESVTVDDETVSPLLQAFDGSGGLVSLADVGPGPIEITYLVDIPADAAPGSTFAFDGGFNISDEEASIGGFSEITVAEDAVLPANVVVTIDAATSDTEVTAGEEVVVEYTVENIGDEPGERDIVASVDTESIDSTTVDLDPGEAETGTFTYETDDTDVPDIEITVDSGDDADTLAVSVTEADTDDTDGDGPDDGDGDDADGDEDDEDGFGFGFGPAVVVIAVFAAVVIEIRAHTPAFL